MTWCCVDEQPAEEWFNHNVQLLCLNTVAHLPIPAQWNRRKYIWNGRPPTAKPPETPVFGFHVNNWNSKTNCRLSPDDFSSKRSNSSSKPGDKQQSSSLAGLESQVRVNTQIPKSKMVAGALGQGCSMCDSEICDLSQSQERGEVFWALDPLFPSRLLQKNHNSSRLMWLSSQSQHKQQNYSILARVVLADMGYNDLGT